PLTTSVINVSNVIVPSTTSGIASVNASIILPPLIFTEKSHGITWTYSPGPYTTGTIGNSPSCLKRGGTIKLARDVLGFHLPSINIKGLIDGAIGGAIRGGILGGPEGIIPGAIGGGIGGGYGAPCASCGELCRLFCSGGGSGGCGGGS